MPMACRRMAIVQHLQAANASVQAGSFRENNQEVRVDAGNVFARREDLEARRRRRRSWARLYTCEMLPARSWTAQPIHQTMWSSGLLTRQVPQQQGNILR